MILICHELFWAFFLVEWSGSARISWVLCNVRKFPRLSLFRSSPYFLHCPETAPQLPLQSNIYENQRGTLESWHFALQNVTLWTLRLTSGRTSCFFSLHACGSVWSGIKATGNTFRTGLLTGFNAPPYLQTESFHTIILWWYKSRHQREKKTLWVWKNYCGSDRTVSVCSACLGSASCLNKNLQVLLNRNNRLCNRKSGEAAWGIMSGLQLVFKISFIVTEKKMRNQVTIFLLFEEILHKF